MSFSFSKTNFTIKKEVMRHDKHSVRCKNTHTITFKNKEHEEFYLKNYPKMEDIHAKNKTSRNNK